VLRADAASPLVVFGWTVASASPSVIAFDISPRVLAHLDGSRQRAARGESYRVHLPLEVDTAETRVDPALGEYWSRLGERIGTTAADAVPAAFATRARARVVDVRPAIVRDVTGVDLNVVVARLSLPPEEQFDLVVATNVLVYYDAFAQALAVRNMSAMLASGGLLMTNQPVPVPGVSGLEAVLISSVDFDRVATSAGAHSRGDSIYVYRKGQRE
jgi:SAM-dependent methyltransferase